MRAAEFTESVNDKLFWTGYEKKKPILDGQIILVATAGYVGYGAKPDFKSNQFRIVAKLPGGAEIGWVNFEKHGDHLEALDLSIQPAFRRKGIATEMYRFARELGNDIAPSKMQTGMGKQFWNKDHSKELAEETTDMQFRQASGADVPRNKLIELAALIATGGEVAGPQVMTNLVASPLITWAEDQHAVGVIVLKRPQPQYCQKVFASAGVPDESQKYNLELGYTYVTPKHRQDGISMKLMRLMASKVPTGVFATTREQNTTINTLLKYGRFRTIGQPWVSERGGYNLLLWVKV